MAGQAGEQTKLDEISITFTGTNLCTYSFNHVYCESQMDYTSCSSKCDNILPQYF